MTMMSSAGILTSCSTVIVNMSSDSDNLSYHPEHCGSHPSIPYFSPTIRDSSSTYWYT